MVDSTDELKSSRSVAGKNFQNFEMLDVIQNSHFKKKVSLEEQKVQKEDWFLRGRQIAFMIYDYFRVTGAHETVLDYADLFSITLRNDNVQEFDTRWYEILLSMTKIPSDDTVESLYKLRIRESDQLRSVLESYDLEIQQKISMPNYQRLKTGSVVKSHRGLSGVERGKGFLTSGKKKASVRRETNAVSVMRETIVRNRHRKPNRPLSQYLQKHEVEVCREKEMPEAQASLRNSIGRRVNTF